ncbi:MAG: DUF2382 domain-containing protein [Cyanobacteria bacterium P01_G01_bin.19]
MTLSNDQHAELNTPEAYQISLLEEKLHVTRQKQKVGEVIVRKEVETKMVAIPVRREKLVVEKAGKNPEKLSETILSTEKINGFTYDEIDDCDTLHSHKSHFVSLTKAKELLAAVEQTASTSDIKVRIEIVSSCVKDEAKLQEICMNCRD